ncbi:Nicotinate phosphoribosyltransferase [Legionella sainthelensi]|nr:Nicotinate phosphoribosyltransferase [Legionella sainthelensi]
MFDFTGSYTDQYQLTMAQVYFLKGHENSTAVFDYFSENFHSVLDMPFLLDLLICLRY